VGFVVVVLQLYGVAIFGCCRFEGYCGLDGVHSRFYVSIVFLVMSILVTCSMMRLMSFGWMSKSGCLMMIIECSSVVFFGMFCVVMRFCWVLVCILSFSGVGSSLRSLLRVVLMSWIWWIIWLSLLGSMVNGWLGLGSVRSSVKCFFTIDVPRFIVVIVMWMLRLWFESPMGMLKVVRIVVIVWRFICAGGVG